MPTYHFLQDCSKYFMVASLSGVIEYTLGAI